MSVRFLGPARRNGARRKGRSAAVRIFAGEATIEVNVADAAALEAEVARRLAGGTGFALATLNLDHLVKLRESPGFRAAYAAQDLVTADGNPIVWMSRLARRPVALLPGSDLVDPLARIAARAGAPVGLVGSTAHSLEGAADALTHRVPGLVIAARIAPPMGFDPDSPAADAVLDELRARGVRLCFLALGAPKQEMLAARGRVRTPEIGFASIGAGLDFLSGQQTRAPRWVRRIAMEWLFRMLGDPQRLARRYALSALILPGHALRALRQRRG